VTERIEGQGFVWLRSSTDIEAVALLVRRFPFMLELGESEQELAVMGAFYAYGLLAREIVARALDEDFLRDAAKFVNELATSNDSYLENLACIGILEAIVDTPEVDEKLMKYLGAKALEMRKKLRDDSSLRTSI
jgi:hypothetical protein